MARSQYVYVLKDLTKAFAGGREVSRASPCGPAGRENGVLGVNGAGKSTL